MVIQRFQVSNMSEILVIAEHADFFSFRLEASGAWIDEEGELVFLDRHSVVEVNALRAVVSGYGETFEIRPYERAEVLVTQ